MNAVYKSPTYSLSDLGRDRLIFSIFVVALAHALLVFGVRFIPEDPLVIPNQPAIEIIISQSSNSLQPDQADYLGLSNSTGGDPEILEKLRRSDLFATLSPNQDLGISPVEQKRLNSRTSDAPAPEQLASLVGRWRVGNQPKTKEETRNEQINSPINQQALQIASMTRELRLKREKLSKQNRKLTLNSSTREYIAASYIKEWVNGVESIGNTNMPANSGNISGNVILEVVIGNRGQLIKSRVMSSSGHPILDQAALNSVKLASPFKAFPNELSKKADILSIIRTWRYEQSRLATITSQ